MRGAACLRRRVICLARDRRGTSAVEIALLSPVLILLLLGTVEVTQLVRVEAKLARSAQAIQNIVAGGPPTTSAPYLDIAFNGGQLVMTPFGAANLTATIVGVSYDAGGSGTVNWQLTENSDRGLSVAAACALAGGMSLTRDGIIVVRTTYTYHPVISYVFGKTYTLTQTAFGRPRNVASIGNSSSSNGPTGSC